jgi:cyclophilin family peptidyl-prolyl cis-trans isomerase
MRFGKLLATLFGVVMTGAMAQAANPVVVIETSYGTIKAELFEDKSPISVKNFLQYTDDKHYDGTIFHRVMDGFMIQGGGFEPGMREKKTRDPIKNESANGVMNARGTLAMARLPGPDTATAQFFINLVDNRFLNPSGANAGYAVFGKVIEGMEVVDKIAKVRTGNKGGHEAVPVDDIVIKSVRRQK